jgi:hypothetical protein
MRYERPTAERYVNLVDTPMLCFASGLVSFDEVQAACAEQYIRAYYDRDGRFCNARAAIVFQMEIDWLRGATDVKALDAFWQLANKPEREDS